MRHAAVVLVTAGVPVTFSTNASGATVSPTSGTSDGEGRLEVSMTSFASGSLPLTATVGALSFSLTATFSAGAPARALPASASPWASGPLTWSPST